MNQADQTDAVRRLGIRHPIIQGPFGGGLSTARLAATVSNLGGLGSYGAYSLPPEENPGRCARDPRAHLRALRAQSLGLGS